MNIALLMLVISEICLGVCAWLSPEWLRWLAAHLLTRADVIDVSKIETKRRMQFWCLELGVDGPVSPRNSNEGTELESGFSRRHASN